MEEVEMGEKSLAETDEQTRGGKKGTFKGELLLYFV